MTQPTATKASTPPAILVCKGASCRNAGSKATFFEIEELVRGLGECRVSEVGCLGACGKAPNAVIVEENKKRKGDKIFSRIRNVNASAAVVQKALGKKPCLDDVDLRNRLNDIKMRVRCNYSLWRLEAISEVSKHTAVYHFTSRDPSRGTPNPIGRGRTVWPKTWHTTLRVESVNTCQGSAPYTERAYTPISSATEWENGRCDLLIKIYSSGTATSWLYKQPLGCNVWLSQPHKTLDVPSLVPDLSAATFKRPASVLLILGGTGIVTAAQVLQHREPVKEGVAPAMTVPVSLICSCREDDVLLAKSMVDWCQGRLDRCTLLMTPSQLGVLPLTTAGEQELNAPRVLPFPAASEPVLDELESLDNARVLHTRLTVELLVEELSAMQSPCRIVVSGPVSFNSDVTRILSENGVHADAITTLSA